MEQPKLFRRNPTEIRAIQWTGENISAVRLFTDPGGQVTYFEIRDGKGYLYVAANDAWLPIELGEWIAQDQFGFYPIKDDRGHPSNYTEAGYDRP